MTAQFPAPAFIGIDPGLMGAIAVLNQAGAPLNLWDMPTRGNRVDPYKLADLLHPYKGAQCCIELVQSYAGDAGYTMFTFGHGAGVCEGVTAALNMTIGKPRPQLWKRAFSLHRAGKDGSVKVARQLFPALHIARHDQAEALLLARFCFLNRQRWHLLIKEMEGEKIKPASKGVGRGKTRKRATKKDDDDDMGVLVL